MRQSDILELPRYRTSSSPSPPIEYAWLKNSRVSVSPLTNPPAV